MSFLKQYSDELVREAPYLQPYTSALINALSHILNNYHPSENSSQTVSEEAVLIFLSSANITSVDISMAWGNVSAANETVFADLINGAFKLVIETKIFGDLPVIYQSMEQILASNVTNTVVESFFEMFAWLTSTEATAMDLLSQAPLKLYNIIKPIVYVLTGLYVPEPVDLALYEDYAANIISVFNQFSSNSSLRNQQELMFQSEMASDPHVNRVRRKRDVSTVPMTRQPIDDIIAMFSIDYSSIYGAAFVPPTSTDVMETAHVFFGNPHLNAVVKGATSDMQWSLNASREDTIDAALGVASVLTHPQTLEK